MSDFTLRPGVLEDANECARICYVAFKTIAEKHGFPPDFPSADRVPGLMQMLLSRQDVYSIIAEKNGKILGSNFLKFSGAVGGIGPITVDPDGQNTGVGRALMEEAIAHGHAKNLVSIRLIQAAYHNRSLSLYTKLGFDVMEPLANIQGPKLELTIPGYTVRQASKDDVEECDKLSYRLHGYQRGTEFQTAIERNTASVVEHNGRISGFTTGIGYYGYAVAETNEDLKALIAASPTFAGPGFLLPTRNSELFRWCLAHGLHVVQPATLMSMGLYKDPVGVFLPSISF